MATPAALTELRMNGVFTMAAPVLQIGNKFHTYNELFTQDRINQDKIENLLSDARQVQLDHYGPKGTGSYDQQLLHKTA